MAKIVEQIDETQSLCPVCLNVIPANLVNKDGKIYMNKKCPMHGQFEAYYWGDMEHYEWCRKFDKLEIPERSTRVVGDGCPQNCGLCSQHKQRTVLAEIDVTPRCNLSCPVCFASAKESHKPDPSIEVITEMFQTIKENEGEGTPTQLSGGESTLRDDLPDIVRTGFELGFTAIEISTNGIRLARDPKYVSELKEAGVSEFYLQFDGLTSDVYQKLRGVDLLGYKLNAIENCRRQEIPVILAPTIVRNVNDHQLGAIIDFAIKNLDIVKGVSIQPAFQSGRYPTIYRERLSLVDIAKLIEEQTGGAIKYKDFYPIPCSDPHCSNATMIVVDSGSMIPITNYIPEDTYLRLYDMRSPQGATYSDMLADKSNINKLGLPWDIADIIERLLTIIMMGYMDAWTMDLNRLSKCSLHVVTPDKRLIPFCIYNITNVCGKSLYRGTLTQTQNNENNK